MTMKFYQLPGIHFYGALSSAIEQNNKYDVELLIRRIVDEDIGVPEGNFTCLDTVLLAAVHMRNAEMVKVLLKNNANPNSDIQYFQKPLMVAIHNKLNVIKLLIEYGANVNDSYINQFIKQSCLHVAVKNYNFKAVKLLLNDFTIDVNVTSSDGNSVLHELLRGICNIDILKHLLDAGIDIDLKNRIGQTACDMLYSNPPDFMKTFKEHIVKLSAASLYVSEKNSALIANSEEFSEVRYRCMEEIENMKNNKIGSSNFTYYDLLGKCEHKLAVGLKHVPDNNISDLDIPSLFPLYGGMLTYRLKRVLGRKKLLIDVTDLVYDFFDDIRLPSTFTSMIFNYLTNGDLKKFVV